MPAYNFDNICELLRKDFNSKPSPWHLIGYRNGRKLFVTESTLRRATVEQLLEDDSVTPVRRPRKLVVSRKRPPIWDSLIGELLGWLWSSFWNLSNWQRM